MVPHWFTSFILACLALHIVPGVTGLDFGSSQWIWTDELSTPGGIAPIGARAFRKDFVPPLGKIPVQADIIITVDDAITLYVNGVLVGTGGDYQYAERFCVALRPCLNVFAVTAVNDARSAGLLAAIQITYSDGTTSTIISDTTWRFSTTVPNGYEQLSFDDNSWTPAIAEGVYGVGIAPWGPIAIPSTPPVLSLTNANWIWTNEVVNGVAPVGSRAFRYTYTPPTGQVATSATMIIIADNEYSVYANGVLIGSASNFQVAQQYTINFTPAPNVVFAVNATNVGPANNPAGLLVAIEINSANSECNCTSGAYLRTDETWKSNTGTPIGFELPSFNDSSWPAATLEGVYGVAPWGIVPVT
ncbi:lectin [Mycena metata]|uniref:Lectin n=1 Tax=Mycena metata TaxID=1033252 RepID=A0AAD7M7I4_9AGAR|nr:lectin [Mycena metata]